MDATSPIAKPAVHIEDRGYQFADGVYEVVPVFNGRLVDEEPHLDRLGLFARRTAALPRPVRAPHCGWSARAAAAERSAARHPLSAGHPRRRATRPQVSRRGEIGARGDHKKLWGSHGRMIEEGARVITIPDIRWAPLRYQVGVAAAQRSRQAAGGGAGRLRGLDGRRRRQCHRRHLDQRLDRHRRTSA